MYNIFYPTTSFFKTRTLKTGQDYIKRPGKKAPNFIMLELIFYKIHLTKTLKTKFRHTVA